MTQPAPAPYGAAAAAIAPIVLFKDTQLTVHASGNATGPTAGQQLCATTALPAGTWEVTAQVSCGSVAGLECNANLNASGVSISRIMYSSGINSAPGCLVAIVQSDGTYLMQIKSILADPLAVVIASIAARRVA